MAVYIGKNSTTLMGGEPASGSSPVLQTKSKTYTPSTSTQTEAVTYNVGYDGLNTVNITVNPIPSNYGLITWDGSKLTVS